MYLVNEDFVIRTNNDIEGWVSGLRPANLMCCNVMNEYIKQEQAKNVDDVFISRCEIQRDGIMHCHVYKQSSTLFWGTTETHLYHIRAEPVYRLQWEDFEEESCEIEEPECDENESESESKSEESESESDKSESESESESDKSESESDESESESDESESESESENESDE